MMVLTSTSRGYELFKIKTEDHKGYYLYNKSGGVWYTHKENTQEFSDNITMQDIKRDFPEYLL